MEGDGLSLDLPLLYINLVAGKNDRDLLADTDKVTCTNVRLMAGQGTMKSLTVPVGNILVGDAGGDVEHDDTALAVDVVPIS